jgi:hypothetical protein
MKLFCDRLRIALRKKKLGRDPLFEEHTASGTYERDSVVTQKPFSFDE